MPLMPLLSRKENKMEACWSNKFKRRGRGQDGRALRRSLLRSAASARRSDLWPAWGRPGGFLRVVRLSPVVPGAAVPVGAGLCRVGGRSEARPDSLGAAAARRGALPEQRDGPSPWGPLEPGLWGLRAWEPSWGPLMTGMYCGAWRWMLVAPERRKGFLESL
ncbi:hypothetical protein NDU88_000074 [Pleurodeles waltl]|uniref:Uncharacterized protein n=1 Tax=Pleurodeles waltl TaxID=8319 RepID=A0AAV7VSE8_PLEWA|nr:hypothetical protein NDU88_000074 [Pleurodeles waltl]